MQRLRLEDKPCVGLFGTRATSNWRNTFIDYFSNFGVHHYNPLIPPTSASEQDDRHHLENDEILLFPITDESYSIEEIDELRHCISSITNSTHHQTATSRFLVIFIDPKLDESLVASNPVDASTSRLARTAAITHLKANPHPNIFVVYNTNHLRVVATRLYDLCIALKELHFTFNITRRN